MLAILAIGLVIGQYAYLTRMFREPHSYGFPEPPGRVFLF